MKLQDFFIEFREAGHMEVQIVKDGPQLTGIEAIDAIRELLCEHLEKIDTEPGKEEETRAVDGILAAINHIRFSKFNVPQTVDPLRKCARSRTFKSVYIMDDKEDKE